jgi:hypothetical protein
MGCAAGSLGDEPDIQQLIVFFDVFVVFDAFSRGI